MTSLSVYTLKDISASRDRLCHLLSKNYKSACAICWENIIRVSHSHPEIEISFKFIPKILMSKECIHFLGHSVFSQEVYLQTLRNRVNGLFRISFNCLQNYTCSNAEEHSFNM